MQVSVIITCHNYARYLARAIRSAINQSVNKNEYEVIVVDDASTDETQLVMEAFKGHIKPIILKKNLGLAAARNKGIRSSLGRYVVNLDADDYMDENLILVESMFLNSNPSWDAVSCDYIVVDDDENHIERVNGDELPIACGVMFRTDRLFEVGTYDEKFKMREEEEDLANQISEGPYDQEYRTSIVPIQETREQHDKEQESNEGVCKIPQDQTQQRIISSNI